CTSMRVMELPEFAEATIGVGQLTDAERDGLRMLTPGAAAFASTRVAATADAPRLLTTVAVTVKSPTCAYWCVATGPARRAPSPKSIVVSRIEPLESDDPAVEACTVRSPTTEVFRTACGAA